MVISSLFLQDSAGSPNGSVTTRFLEEETLRSQELLQRLDVHIQNMKQENANTVSKYLGKDSSPQNGHWVPWSELAEICKGDDLSVWPFLFKKKNVFWQLVWNHKSCNMIGQDQCSKNDTKAVPNNFCPKSADSEYLHDYCTSEGMTTYTLPPCFLDLWPFTWPLASTTIIFLSSWDIRTVLLCLFLNFLSCAINIYVV